MKKNICTAAIIFIAAVLQSMLCPYIKIGSVMPGLLCVFALYSALHEKSPVRNMITAAAAGAVMDCLTGRIFGLYTAVYLVISVLACLIKDTLFKDGILINIPVVFVLSILGSSLFYIMNISVLKSTSFGYSLIFVILPEAVYNTAVYTAAAFFAARRSRKKAGIMR